MAKDNTDLKNQIDQKNNKLAKLGIQDQLAKWKNDHFEKLAALSGSKDAADKVFVICMNTISKNPDLLECTFESIASCILQSFQLNLFPGPFQECGYVPLKNGKLSNMYGREIKEANFWPQYQGLVKLVRNAGNKAVTARVVFENDYFEYREGLEGPVYAPAVVMGKKRGKPLFAYASICTSADMYQVEVLDLDQIETIKSRSRGAQKPDSPWNSKYDDDRYVMWAKSALKRCTKWCTKSAELVMALEADNEVDGDPSFSKAKVLDLVGNGAEGQPLQPSMESQKELPEPDKRNEANFKVVEGEKVPVDNSDPRTEEQKAMERQGK